MPSHHDIDEYTYSHFKASLKHNDLSRAEKIMTEYPAVFMLGPRYFETTWAHYACREGLPDVALWAIEKGVNIEHVDSRRNTPLMQAVFRGHSTVVETLLRAGANPFATDSLTKLTALHNAARSDHSHDCLKILLVKYKDLEIRSVIDTTPLYEAVSGGAVNNAKALLEAGADWQTSAEGVSLTQIAKRRVLSKGGDQVQALLQAHLASLAIDLTRELHKLTKLQPLI